MADEGKTGGKQIARLEKGNKVRTARHASVMNEIIDRLNSFIGLKVTPDGSGKFIFGEANAVLQLEGTGCEDGFQCVPDPPESGTYVLGVIDGTVQWIETADCSGIDGGGAF